MKAFFSAETICDNTHFKDWTIIITVIPFIRRGYVLYKPVEIFNPINKYHPQNVFFIV